MHVTVDDSKDIRAIITMALTELMPEFVSTIKSYQEPDRVVTELWLRENVFGTPEKPCSHTTFKNKYRFAPGFPVMLPENGGNEQFSTRAVYQWIADNQTRME